MIANAVLSFKMKNLAVSSVNIEANRRKNIIKHYHFFKHVRAFKKRNW